MRLARIALAAGVCLTLLGELDAEGWKPGAGPLRTRWAKNVSPDNVHREYPRPQMVRSDWLCLNGVWQLGVAKADEPPPIGKQLPEGILVPFPIESALSGVMKRAERAWYRRTFRVPQSWKGRRVLLHFQAVDWEAVVLVNGQQVGAHRGGYDAFSLDITDALTSSDEQELIVKVFDPTDSPQQGNQPRGKQVLKPGGIWYTPSTGIWQTVWLEPVPAARIQRLKLIPDVDQTCLRLTVEGVGTGEGNSIQAVIRDGDRQPARACGRVGEEIRLTIPEHQLKLWSPGEPFLYDLTVTLRQGDVSVDQVESYFGMRKVDLAKDENGVTRIRLNGEFLFQVGTLDQGFWPDGLYTAPSDEALRYDVEVTRQLGFNLARKHVKIEPQRWYFWCDKLGLLVWQDMPSANNKTPESKMQFETELRRMVTGLGNHPSIITWVIFNEGWGQHDTERYVEMVKRLDPGRLVTGASGWDDKGVGDLVDIHRYPGPAAPEPEPRRASVLGEFGGLGLGVDGHTWTDKTWGYRGTESSQELTRRYQGLLASVWELKETRGLSAAVYTQITDVETECNGLMTYDRAVVKVDAERAADANRGRVPRPKPVVAASVLKGVPWRYTFEQPGEDWNKPGYEASSWSMGPGGFGTRETPGAVVRTEWKTSDIWIRREFTLPPRDTKRLDLLVHHDEDAEIYINGVLAARVTGYSKSYEVLPMKADARAALRPGKNLLAVHCKHTTGGQYVDVGIVEWIMPPP